MRAEGHRHLATIWQSKEFCWKWWVLQYGWSQPGRLSLGRSWEGNNWWRRNFTLHFTPIHISRWTGELEIGICIGKRTIYLLRHS